VVKTVYKEGNNFLQITGKFYHLRKVQYLQDYTHSVSLLLICLKRWLCSCLRLLWDMVQET